MQTRTILIIEDEVEIAELVSIHLRNEGFATLLAHDGKSGLTLFQQRSIDLVILDIMMPEMNGHEVLTQIRQINQTPVIFLSAKQSDFDKISGLVIGADDYMTKPFNPLEVGRPGQCSITACLSMDRTGGFIQGRRHQHPKRESGCRSTDGARQ